MHLKIQNRNGRSYLSIVQSYRMNGKVRTRTVETIGYADRYLDRYEDPIAHFRRKVEEMNEDASSGMLPIELSFNRNDAIPADAPPLARLGAAVALGCLDSLGVREFFQSRAGRNGFPPNAGRVFEMLATERMMHATSKRESWTARESFPRACEFSFEEVYAALPCFARESRHIEQHLQRSWRKIAGEATVDTVYLVCGTYAFPAEGGQQGGETVFSLVVALDRNAMPLGFETRPGPLSPQVICEAGASLRERIGARRSIVIVGPLRQADALPELLASTGGGFIMLQSDLSTSPWGEWVEDERGWAPVGDGVSLKSRTMHEAGLDNEGASVKVVALKGGDYSLKRGRAVIATSETSLGAMEVVQLFRELWRQAEPFQPLEADFAPMPSGISTTDHVEAHFLLCYASFFALRALRWKMGWKHNAADTADALLRMEGVHLKQNYYLFSYRSAATDDIEEALGLPVARRVHTQQDMKSVPRQVHDAFLGRRS